ncbi:MAG TPA: primosomal protein N' [Woeseiaceae bacterium]|nr:primosomal protein N' [Woeseiaceae bacterium]
MGNAPVLKVAINVPLSRLFDYLPPADGSCPPPGARVRVPFGRQRQVGLVLAHAGSSDVPQGRMRRVIEVLDDKPLLREQDLWLIGFTSDYYHHPVGEVAAAAVPALLRQGRPLNPLLRHVAATDAARGFDIEALARKAPRQAELLEMLLDAGGNGMDAEALAEQMPAWRRSFRALARKALVTEFEMRADDPEPPSRREAAAGPALNPDQQAALDEIRSRPGFHTSILDGVTGSGKTEVYLNLIAETLAAGRQVLVLVPEIGLTPQLVTRLRTRLGIEPALLHSGLSDLDRLRAWRQARNGDAKLVVGTRSAVFTPMQDAGLVIVDEEHDHSFKQQEGLRYSARDLAIARAKHLDIPIVLGSATPTLDVLHHCGTGSYSHLSLPRRAGAAQPPEVRIVDLGRAASTEGLSEPLAQAISQHLAESGQVLIYLNRRGFAPTLICSGCGHVAECSRCDSRMTVHAKDGRLRCHHCGSARPLDEVCSECGSAMRPLGEGTQRLEDELVRRYPGRQVMRIDSDSTQRKGAIDEALQRATRGDAEILVGTQMLSKGHHFPKLTLVGVVNADQGLFGTDFRSDERLAQSIIQVAGRAGRESRVGEVIIQTAFPAHPFWKRLIEGGYSRVAEDALEERRAANWPPFSRLALLRSAAARRSDAHAFLEVAAGFIAGLSHGRIRVLGPVDAPMARRAGRYRAQLLLQSTDRRALHAVLRELRPMLEADPAARKVRWSIDVDPVELF